MKHMCSITRRFALVICTIWCATCSLSLRATHPIYAKQKQLLATLYDDNTTFEKQSNAFTRLILLDFRITYQVPIMCTDPKDSATPCTTREKERYLMPLLGQRSATIFDAITQGKESTLCEQNDIFARIYLQATKHTTCRQKRRNRARKLHECILRFLRHCYANIILDNIGYPQSIHERHTISK